MCADRMRSIIIAIVLGLSLGLIAGETIKYMFIIQLVLIIALLIDGFSGFCPIRSALRAILPKCEDR